MGMLVILMNGLPRQLYIECDHIAQIRPRHRTRNKTYETSRARFGARPNSAMSSSLRE
jgi:hypothetical protein